MRPFQADLKNDSQSDYLQNGGRYARFSERKRCFRRWAVQFAKGGDGERRLAINIITYMIFFPVHRRRTCCCLDLLLLRAIKSHSAAGAERSRMDRLVHSSNHDDGPWEPYSHCLLDHCTCVEEVLRWQVPGCRVKWRYIRITDRLLTDPRESGNAKTFANLTPEIRSWNLVNSVSTCTTRPRQ